MAGSIVILLASLSCLHISVCYGDRCRINGLKAEDLENLSYEPPGKEMLSNEQDKKAWRTFVENYENPVQKVQDWYNSIVDKDSADAAADSFNKDVLPILKKLTGRSADMKKQVLAIPASLEMQKFIFSRILTLQSRLLLVFLPKQDSRKLSSDACYHGSMKFFNIFLGTTETTITTSMDVAKFIESQNETRESLEASFTDPWPRSTESTH